MKRSELWNRLFNSGGNGIFVFVGTALIAVIAIVITACPGAADATHEEPKFTVSYHANEGEGTPDPETQTVNHGETIAAAPTVSRPDYTLNAVWNTKADGTGETFKFGNGGTPVTADITLYAQWTKQHTVSYQANEGDGTPEPATQTVSDGETIANAPTGISRPGHTLSTAWNTKADGTGDSFLFGDEGTPVTDDITLYAQWTKQYTVSYQANEGEGTPEPATQTVNHNDIIASAPTISRPGYALNAAWNTKADGTGDSFLFGDGGTPVTSDITLYAQWTRQYTVSYDINEGDSTAPAAETVDDGGTFTKPADPTRSGHVFNGWFDADTGGNEYTFGTAVRDDITLYAQWAIMTYTVSYNFNRGDSTEPSTETVEHGGTATRPTTDPTWTGYTFKGWYDAASGGDAFEFGTVVTANIDLYAQWTIKQYTVSYHVNEGTGTPNPETETVNHGETIAAAPTGISRPGHTLNTAWNTKADGIGESFLFGDEGTPVTDDITLYAQWSNQQYTVSYHANGGDGTPVPATQTVNHNDVIATAPTVSRNGYTLNAAWNTQANGQGTPFIFGTTQVTSDMDIYAQWTIQYTVSYHANDGDDTPNPATQAVTAGETIATAPTVSRNGYTLNAQWNTQADGKGESFSFGSGGTPVTANMDLYAQWTINQYTVSYHANENGEGTPNPATQKVDHGETIAAAPTVSRPGYALNAAWNTQANGQGTPFLFGTTQVTSDMDLYAQWTIQYTVSYHANEGDDTPNPAIQAVTAGETIATAPTVSRNGYTLNAQWNTQADGKGESFSFGSGGTPVTANMELYAQWTINQYTVSYHANEGEGTPNPATQKVDHEATIATAPTGISKPGHTLKAVWNTKADGTGHTFSFGSGGTPVTEDMDLYAQWTINRYTVSYNFNRGDSTEPSTETVDHGGTATRPTTDPTRTGYTFTGWFDAATGGNEFNFGSGGTPVTYDITLYAQWTINTYTVSYNFNRGDSTEPSTETVDHGGIATGPTSDPTRIGYTFDGWYTAETGGDAFDFGRAVTADITLYARWTPTLTVSGLSPVNGSSTTDITPTFSWDTVPGAAGYELGIAESQSGLENAATVRVTGTSYTPSAALTNRQTHYWRVRGVDGDAQKGDWSAVHSLDVQLPSPGFVHVAGGTFQMGSTDSDAYFNESPVHSVTVDSFYMAETEVSHRQYLEFLNGAGVSASGQLNGNEVIDMDDGDVAFSHDGTKFSFAASGKADDIDCPVIEVPWYGAVKYSNWLSEQYGLSKAYSISGASVTWNQSANGYRLPTEAEWEYAARGGAQSNGYKYSGSNDVDEVGWYSGNSGSKTHPVKGKKANELGLYDMSGNVWEWCWDRYGSYSSADQTNPVGPSSGLGRVLRGGSWINSSRGSRVADRINRGPGLSSIYDGFRLVRPVD